MNEFKDNLINELLNKNTDNWVIEWMNKIN